MQENSRQLVLAALTHCRGNRMKAATLLELSRAQFYKLVKMRGLDGEPADGAPQQDPKQKNAIGCHELQARGECSKEHPIASKWEMPARSRVQSRAKKKCSKEGPPNYEQKRIARRKMRPIAILNIGGCGYAPIGGSPDRTMQQHIQVFLT